MRPALYPQNNYTILTEKTARKHLFNDYGIPLKTTKNDSLNDLHDRLTEHVIEELAGNFVIVSERTYKKINEFSKNLLARYHGLPLEPKASISSFSNAISMLGELGVEVPADAERDGLEDALSAAKSTRYMILDDDDFIAYGKEMVEMLTTLPTGRAK